MADSDAAVVPEPAPVTVETFAQRLVRDLTDPDYTMPTLSVIVVNRERPS